MRAPLPAELDVDADSDVLASELVRRVVLASFALDSDGVRPSFVEFGASVQLSEDCARVAFTTEDVVLLSVMLSVDGVRMPLGNEDASIMSLLLS